MSLPRFTHLLNFMLPARALGVTAPAAGWPYGCLVEFGRIGLVSVMGPSREAVFDAAALMLRRSCQHLTDTAIAARLYTFPPERKADGRDWLEVANPGGGVDGWSIVVGATVAFSPTALEPYFPSIQNQARPAPRAIER